MRRNRQKSWRSLLSNDRETVRQLSPKSQKEKFILPYNHMLIEDVKTKIMPSRHYDKQKETSVIQLCPPDTSAQKNISLVLSENRYPSQNLEDEISYFIKECASIIMNEGQAIYEIVNYKNKTASESSFLKLEPVPRGIIKFFLGRALQILPKLEELEGKEPCFKRITKDKLVIFRMPKPYRTNYKELQSQLDMLGKEGTQNLYTKSLEEIDKHKKLNLNQKANISKYSKLFALSATNLIGWNARDFRSNHLQEYFTLVRFLRFERFKLALRNSILNTINNNLNRLLPNSTYNGRLEFRHLPTDEDIEKAEKYLREGNKKFNDIFKLFQV